MLHSFLNWHIEEINLSAEDQGATALGRFFFRTMASNAELERDIISEGTKAGLSAAGVRGKCGERHVADQKKVAHALKVYKSIDYSISQIVQATGISQATLYRNLKARN